MYTQVFIVGAGYAFGKLKDELMRVFLRSLTGLVAISYKFDVIVGSPMLFLIYKIQMFLMSSAKVETAVADGQALQFSPPLPWGIGLECL